MKNIAISALIIFSLFGQLLAQYQDEVLVTEARKAIKQFNITTADSAYKAAMAAAPDEDRYNEIQKEWQILEKVNIHLADASRAQKRSEYSDALKKYQDAIKEMDASPHKIWGRFKGETYYGMGMVYFRQEQPTVAADRFRDAMKVDPSEEKYGRSIEMVRNKHYSEGHKFLKRKDYESAKVEYLKAVSVDPEFASGYYQLAYIAKRDEDLKSAEMYYTKAVTSDPTHYKGWYGLGNLYHEEGNNSKAIEALKQSIAVNASYEKPYYVLGKVYESQKNNNLAISNLKKAIEIDKQYTIAYELLGKIYIDEENYQAAINLLKGLTGKTTSYTTNFRLAQAYNFTSNYSAALTAASKSNTAYRSQKNKDWAAALIEKGDALRGLNRNKEAITAYRGASKDPRWENLAKHRIDELLN